MRQIIVQILLKFFLNISEDAFIPAHENRDKYGRSLKTINLKKDAIPTLFLDNPDTNDPLRVVPIKTQECKCKSGSNDDLMNLPIDDDKLYSMVKNMMKLHK